MQNSVKQANHNKSSIFRQRSAKLSLALLEEKKAYHYLLLGGIFLFGLVLRFYKLGEWSLWIDEFYTVEDALRVFELPLFSQPLSQLLSGLIVSQFGATEFYVRLPAALVGAVTIPVLYFLTRSKLKASTGLLASLLLAVAPWHVFWSQNARFYVMLLLLYTLAIFVFYRIMDSKEHRFWYMALFVLLLILSLQERLFAAFLIPVIFGYLVVLNLLSVEIPPLFRMRNLILLLAAPALLFVVLDGVSFMTRGDSIFLSFLEKFIGNPNKGFLRFALSFVYRLGIPTLMLGLVGAVYSVVQRHKLGLLLTVSALLPPIALTVITPFVFTVDRYAFVSLTSWVILSAIALKEAFYRSENYGRFFVLGVLLLVLADAMSQNLLYYQYQKGGRPDWQGAFALVEAQQEAGDIVYANRVELGHYYLGDDVKPIEQFEPDDVNQAESRQWFVISTSNSGIDPVLYQWILANSTLIDVLDVSIPGKILDMRVYRYEPPPLE